MKIFDLSQKVAKNSPLFCQRYPYQQSSPHVGMNCWWNKMSSFCRLVIKLAIGIKIIQDQQHSHTLTESCMFPQKLIHSRRDILQHRTTNLVRIVPNPIRFTSPLLCSTAPHLLRILVSSTFRLFDPVTLHGACFSTFLLFDFFTFQL